MIRFNTLHKVMIDEMNLEMMAIHPTGGSMILNRDDGNGGQFGACVEVHGDGIIVF
jgi:hypothetical protein